MCLLEFRLLRLSEKIMICFIFGMIGIHVIMQVTVPTINSQIAEMKPIPARTATIENSTVEAEVQNADGPPPPRIASGESTMIIPERPSISTVMSGSLNNLGFALFVAFAGIGITLPWQGVMVQQFPEEISVLVPVLFFWFSSMASIPIVFWFSRQIPWWRKGPYLYLIPVLIGGIGITYFTNFGA